MQNVPVKFDTFTLAGGLDLVTPTTAIPPGVAREALNFEVSITGGYSRILGYERYDGRVGQPSAASVSGITVNTLGSIAVGSTISNGTGATGTVIAILNLTIYYTQAVNAFALGDVVNGTSTVTILGLNNLTPAQLSPYTALAANVYRALITPVPGSGPVRGVWDFDGTVYAFRDNTGATAMGMYRATTSGWVQVVFGYELSFTCAGGNTTAISDGASILDGTGATATVARVVLETGSWASSTASGRLILSATSGAWTAGHNIKVGSATLATVAPPAGSATYLASARISYAAGGTQQIVESNFGGATPNKMYGADGANRAWEFDGTTFVPIRTGMPTDTPTCCAVHENYLFLTFAPSVQFSSIAAPYSWQPILGAGEFVVNGAVTNLTILPGNQTSGALGIFTNDNTFILYGTSSSTFQLATYNTGVGAYSRSCITMEDIYSIADRGVANMTTTLNYGNFETASLTLNVYPYIQARRGNLSCAGVNRQKSQYRLFYNDGSGLYLTINNGRFLGAMPVLFPNVVRCWTECSPLSAAETAYFGSDDGYVRRMDVGTSFDGAAIPFTLTLNFDNMGNPRVLKRYRKAALEMAATAYTSFQVGYTLAYNDSQAKNQPLLATYSSSFNAPQWDTFTWDNFYWDGQGIGPLEIEVEGSGENIALAIQGTTDCFAPFTINSATIHYTPRRGLR